jgi:uncharacterized protein (UPF0297 family)
VLKVDETIKFDVNQVNEEFILTTLKEVKNILEEKGYNSINQIVGYLISGDPGYITSYKNARNMIASLDRSKTLEVLIKKSLI